MEPLKPSSLGVSLGPEKKVVFTYIDEEQRLWRRIELPVDTVPDVAAAVERMPYEAIARGVILPDIPGLRAAIITVWSREELYIEAYRDEPSYMEYNDWGPEGRCYVHITDSKQCLWISVSPADTELLVKCASRAAHLALYTRRLVNIYTAVGPEKSVEVREKGLTVKFHTVRGRVGIFVNTWLPADEALDKALKIVKERLQRQERGVKHILKKLLHRDRERDYRQTLPSMTEGET